MRFWRKPSALPPRIDLRLRKRPTTHQSASGAVLRGGLKNGKGTTLADTVLRAASTVNSILSVEPKVALSRLMEAKAIMRFSVGDHVVEVALPTWRPAR